METIGEFVGERLAADEPGGQPRGASSDIGAPLEQRIEIRRNEEDA